eukprot:15479695-Alexandrium_andersonii.AAC.1
MRLTHRTARQQLLLVAARTWTPSGSGLLAPPRAPRNIKKQRWGEDCPGAHKASHKYCVHSHN